MRVPAALLHQGQHLAAGPEHADRPGADEPLAVSVKIRVQPALMRVSCCNARVWSRVETRA
jgi:hypothetical protein